MSARIALMLLVALLTAGSSSALTLSLVQVGGTADASSAQVGDTVVISLVVTLEEGDVLTGVGGAIQWDLEGGDVVDIISASEPGSVVLDGKTFSNINGRYRIGVPGTVGTLYEDGESFPPNFPGPTFVWGWELVTASHDPDGIVGPHTFSIGEAELVIRETGTVTVSYLTEGPTESLVLGQGFEINGVIVYEELELGTDFQVSSLSIVAAEAEAVPALGPMGLAIVATALAAMGLRLTGRIRERCSS